MIGISGVSFDGKHCERDYGFLLQSYTIGKAEPIIDMVQVPGGPALDYTDFYGAPQYKERPLEIQLKIIAPYTEQPAKYSALGNAINGRRVKVVFDDDPAWYYDARISVGDLTHNKNGRSGYTTVSALCRPYKRRKAETVVTQSVTTAPVSVTLHNDAQPVVPDIRTTVPCELTFGGGSYSVQAGDILLPDLLLAPGDNVIQVKAASAPGGITFKWRGGSL